MLAERKSENGRHSMGLRRKFLNTTFTFAFLNFPLLGMFWLAHFSRTTGGGRGDSIINLILFLLFAVPHSVLARDFGRRFLSSLVGERRVRMAYVVIAGVTLGAMVWLWRPLPAMIWHFESAGYWMINVFYALGLFGMFYTARFFDVLEFLGLRNLSGRRPAEPPSLSVAGPYAYCRHPLYFGFFIALWATPTMTLGQLEFAVLCSLYLLIGSSLEERNLRTELGQAYEVYCRNVPMWIPRFSPWRGPESTDSSEDAMVGQQT
jgi:methanethiol S-methyltransferase